MKALYVTAACVTMLTACALPTVHAEPDSASAAAPTTMASKSRSTLTVETVDYAGRVCGNQNMHIKAPPCLFPTQRVVAGP